MIIRRSNIEDLELILPLFEYARTFMTSTGNANQWINGYPQKELIIEDINKGDSYVCVNENNELVGVFCFSQEPDPNYIVIENGEWLDNKPYGVIHRIASNGKIKGLADKCISWCFKRCPNLRVDTHEDNFIMQKIFQRNGFHKCGTIYVQNGTPRIAYQKNK